MGKIATVFSAKSRNCRNEQFSTLFFDIAAFRRYKTGTLSRGAAFCGACGEIEERKSCGARRRWGEEGAFRRKAADKLHQEAGAQGSEVKNSGHIGGFLKPRALSHLHRRRGSHKVLTVQRAARLAALRAVRQKWRRLRRRQPQAAYAARGAPRPLRRSRRDGRSAGALCASRSEAHK